VHGKKDNSPGLGSKLKHIPRLQLKFIPEGLGKDEASSLVDG
jgi:hypothetical protein